MKLIPVDNSSNIKAYAYDPATKVLRVQFKNGGTYDYAEVPQETVDAFVEADSKGSYLSVIKAEHEATKVTA